MCVLAVPLPSSTPFFHVISAVLVYGNTPGTWLATQITAFVFPLASQLTSIPVYSVVVRAAGGARSTGQRRVTVPWLPTYVARLENAFGHIDWTRVSTRGPRMHQHTRSPPPPPTPSQMSSHSLAQVRYNIVNAKLLPFWAASAVSWALPW